MLAPVVEWNMRSNPTRAWLLLHGGMDVAASAARSNSYGVDPSSVTVQEEGPGRVSSMSYTIDDPQGQVSVSVGDTVVLWDTVDDVPVFRGWVESYEVSAFGTNRSIAVSAIGLEALLDWMYVPGITIPAGSDPMAVFQVLASNAVGMGFGLNIASTDATSSVATPIGFGFPTGPLTINAWPWTGGTLRQAAQAFADFLASEDPDAWSDQELVFSVDFYGGFRVWLRAYDVDGSYLGDTVSDVQLITMDATAGGVRPSSTRYGVNASGTPRVVYVAGGTGAGVGPVSDGTGVIGPTAVIRQALSTDATKRRGFGQAFLAKGTPGISGTVVAEGTVSIGPKATPNVWKRAGSPLSLRDPQAGIPAARIFITQTIEKSFAPSGEETWTITFGGEAPRASQYLRTLTAGVLQ